MRYNRYGFEFLEIGDNLSAKGRDAKLMINAAREYKTRHEDFNYQIDKENGETILMRVGKNDNPEQPNTPPTSKYNFGAMKIGDRKTMTGDDASKMWRAARAYADYHYDWKFYTERAKDGNGTITIMRIETTHIPISTDNESSTTINETYDVREPGKLYWEATEEHYEAYTKRRNPNNDPSIEAWSRDDYMTLTVDDERETPLPGDPGYVVPMPTRAEQAADGPLGAATLPAETWTGPQHAENPASVDVGELPTHKPADSVGISDAEWSAGLAAVRASHVQAVIARDAADPDKGTTRENGLSDDEFMRRLDIETLNADKTLKRGHEYDARIWPVFDE